MPSANGQTPFAAFAQQAARACPRIAVALFCWIIFLLMIESTRMRAIIRLSKKWALDQVETERCPACQHRNYSKIRPHIVTTR